MYGSRDTSCLHITRFPAKHAAVERPEGELWESPSVRLEMSVRAVPKGLWALCGLLALYRVNVDHRPTCQQFLHLPWCAGTCISNSFQAVRFSDDPLHLHWHRLPRGTVGAPSMEKYEPKLDGRGQPDGWGAIGARQGPGLDDL